MLESFDKGLGSFKPVLNVFHSECEQKKELALYCAGMEAHGFEEGPSSASARRCRWQSITHACELCPNAELHGDALRLQQASFCNHKSVTLCRDPLSPSPHQSFSPVAETSVFGYKDKSDFSLESRLDMTDLLEVPVRIAEPQHMEFCRLQAKRGIHRKPDCVLFHDTWYMGLFWKTLFIYLNTSNLSEGLNVEHSGSETTLPSRNIYFTSMSQNIFRLCFTFTCQISCNNYSLLATQTRYRLMKLSHKFNDFSATGRK